MNDVARARLDPEMTAVVRAHDALAAAVGRASADFELWHVLQQLLNRFVADHAAAFAELDRLQHDGDVYGCDGELLREALKSEGPVFPDGGLTYQRR